MTTTTLPEPPGDYLADLTAADIMHRQVLLADARASVTEVATAMQRARVQHAVVLLDGASLGIVAQDELWVAWSLELGPTSNRSVLPLVVPAPCVTTETGLPQLCQVLVRSRFGAVMVLDDNGDLQGLVTTDDVLRRLAGVADVEPEKC